MTSGCSGLPKLRQFTTATAVAPTQARLATPSARTSAVPARGSSAQARGLESVVMATPRSDGGSPGPASRSSAASAPGPATVFKKSWWSYWRHTQRAERSSASRSAAQSAAAGGASGSAGRRGRRLARAVVERRVVGQRRRRHVGQHRAVHAVTDAQAPAAGGVGRGHRADDGGPHLPLGADGGHGRPRLGRDDGEHALLALARHHLPRLHALLAPRHGGDVHVHADAAAPRRLARGAGEPGAAEVLDPDHELRVEQLQARLDQALLLEGIAHLDAGSLGVVRRPRPR